MDKIEKFEAMFAAVGAPQDWTPEEKRILLRKLGKFIVYQKKVAAEFRKLARSFLETLDFEAEDTTHLFVLYALNPEGFTEILDDMVAGSQHAWRTSCKELVATGLDDDLVEMDFFEEEEEEDAAA